jgi:hypothetical protein
MRKDSILQDRKVCFLSGAEDNLECHHIFFGKKDRKISDENGFWIWLTPTYHRGNYSPHHNKELDDQLKMLCQKKFEETHTRAEFMKLIMKNQLWKEE